MNWNMILGPDPGEAKQMLMKAFLTVNLTLQKPSTREFFFMCSREKAWALEHDSRTVCMGASFPGIGFPSHILLMILPVWAWFGNTNQPRHLVNAPHVLRTSQHMLPLHESSSLPIREDRSAVLHTCIWLILDPPYRFQLPSLHDRRLRRSPCCPAWVERLYTCN